MGRKRIDLPHAVEVEIAARTARGESAETVYVAIGKALSVPTIRRRQRELRGRAPAAPGAATRVRNVVDDVPDEIPEATPIEDLNRWIKRLEEGALVAETDGNLSALASIAAKVTALMALRHKATPLPKLDPNEAPDMRALAAQGRKNLLKLAHDLFTGQVASD